jgi:hypothetical protein
MLTSQERHECIGVIRDFPKRLRDLVEGLTESQLTTAFLDEEWTVAQNVHHLVDSHVNSYVRLKFMLAEDNPPLRNYEQDDWAKFPEAMSADLSYSLTMLDGLHERWARVFENLSADEWERTGQHSTDGPVSVEWMVKTYADHCEAHLDQIQRTLGARTK